MLRKPILLALLLVSGTVATGAALFRDQAGHDVTLAASDFLASLDTAQRAEATMPYDDPRRVQWNFVPLAQRKGLQIKNMTGPQRRKAHAMMTAALSAIGYEKATAIMGLEGLLAELERERKNGPIRDPERYYFTVFGTPAAEATWGWSVEGHHLSLNFAVKDGQILSHTPAFYGVNPGAIAPNTMVAGGLPVGTRVLAKEEDVAFALLASLTPDQLEVALLDKTAPREIRAAGQPQPPRDAPLGMLAGNMTASQQDLLRALIDAYLENMPSAVSDRRREEIRQAGFENIRFAWAGADKPGVGHYYRVEGPTFLIELVNTQPDAAGNPANHIHSVWRDMRGDFGIPLPAEAGQ